MPVTPTWLAATSDYPGQAGQVNQLLGSHAASLLYAAAEQAASGPAGSTSTSTAALYLAQEFTTGSAQTAVGYVAIPLTTTATSGTALPPATVSLCTSVAGTPGVVLASSVVTAEYAHQASGGTATAFINIPLPAPVAASASYWITASAAGTTGAHFTWFRSSSGSGAATSPDGVTWTTAAYGFEYQVYDQTATGDLTCVWEDSGARWTALAWSGSDVATIAEYTAGQAPSGYVQSYRSLTYSGGLLTGVA